MVTRKRDGTRTVGSDEVNTKDALDLWEQSDQLESSETDEYEREGCIDTEKAQASQRLPLNGELPGQKTLKKKRKKKRKTTKKSKSSLLGFDNDLMRAILAAAEQQQQQRMQNASNQRLSLKRSTSTGKSLSKTKNADSGNLNQSGEGRDDPLIERQRMQEHVEKCLQKTEILRGRLESLDLKQRMLEQRIIDEKKRKQMIGGARATFEQKIKIATRTKMLNGKLDRLLKRCGQVETNNVSAKSAIDELRKERLAFEQIQRKLRAEFEIKQKEMAVLLQNSNELNANRIKAEKELERLLREEKTAKLQDENEVMSLEGVIRKQESLQTELQTASLKRRAHLIREQLGRGALDPEEEAKLKARLQSLTVKIEKKSLEIEHTQQNAIFNYEEAFEKILNEMSQRAKKRMNLNEVVNDYVSDYDEAFSLLSYIQGVQDENYKIEAQIMNLKGEMGRLAAEQGKEDRNKERIKKELQGRLEQLRSNTSKLQNGIQDQEKAREEVYAMVERLVARFNAAATAGEELEIQGGTVNDDNIMGVMGRIELKTLELSKSLQQAIRLGTFRAPQFNKAQRMSGASFPMLMRQQTLRMAKVQMGPTSPLRSTQEKALNVQPLSPSKVTELFNLSKNLADSPDSSERDASSEWNLTATHTNTSLNRNKSLTPSFEDPGSPFAEGIQVTTIQSIEELREVIRKTFPIMNATAL